MFDAINYLFSGPDNPADSAQPYLNQISPMLKGYYDPFIQQGQDAYSKINPIISRMFSNPTDYLDSIIKDYAPSKGFQIKRDEMLKAAGNTQAAGGMRGSLQDIDTSAQLTNKLMSDDMQQWLNNVFGIQKTGLDNEMKFYDTGYDASKSLSGDLSNVLGTQAQLGFQGTENKNKMNSDFLSAIAGIISAGMM